MQRVGFCRFLRVPSLWAAAAVIPQDNYSGSSHCSSRRIHRNYAAFSDAARVAIPRDARNDAMRGASVSVLPFHAAGVQSTWSRLWYIFLCMCRTCPGSAINFVRTGAPRRSVSGIASGLDEGERPPGRGTMFKLSRPVGPSPPSPREIPPSPVGPPTPAGAPLGGSTPHTSR